MGYVSPGQLSEVDDIDFTDMGFQAGREHDALWHTH